MRVRSFETLFFIEPACPARLRRPGLRRAFVRPILARPPVRAIQPLSLLQIAVKAFSHGMNIGLFTDKQSLTKSRKNFPLELRAKTTAL